MTRSCRAAPQPVSCALANIQGADGPHPGGGNTESFWLALCVGFLVQGYKGFRDFYATGRWNLRRFVETGGMPSSHAASVSALTTMVGLQEGFTSTLFGATLFFSLIVMYDAAGLRRAAGRQAAVLNRLIEEHFQHPEAGTQRLMELLGHTPLEVLVGALLGVASALLWNRVI
jgi:acid phosphatase family membrane protein YuiD